MFLRGNNLPAAWEGRSDFVIAETGFGTGLNFLAVWKLFLEHSQPHQKLHFISFEKYPLDAEEIALPLQPWAKEFDTCLPRLLEVYPALIPGFHHLDLDERVRLTLIFDDVNVALARVDAQVDVWFLDGFKPSTNPDMWSETVFKHMARLSRPGTRFATFTAAGAVRRGLQAAGFNVKKVPGFGSKRDMSVGVFVGENMAGDGV